MPTSGLRIARSLPEPGPLVKSLRVHSLSHTHTFSLFSLPPLPLSHTQPNPSKKHCTDRGRCFPAERSPRDRVICQAVPELALGRPFEGKALWSRKQPLPGLRPPGPRDTTVTPCPPLERRPLPLDSLAARGCPAQGGFRKVTLLWPRPVGRLGYGR